MIFFLKFLGVIRNLYISFKLINLISVFASKTNFPFFMYIKLSVKLKFAWFFQLNLVWSKSIKPSWIFEFKLFDKAQKSKFSYNGKLNFRPFHSYLMGSATTIDFSHLFLDNAIIKQLLKTGLINKKDYEKIVDPKKMIYPA